MNESGDYQRVEKRYPQRIIVSGRELVRSIKESVGRISLVVYLLFVLFGLVSWTAANGVFSESPVLSVVLPECERLTSYIVIIVQSANIAPLAYLIVRAAVRVRCKRKGSTLDISAIYLVLCLALLSSIFLIFFWSDVTLLNGVQPVSTAFFILTGLLSISDCMSTILFLPFVSLYPNAYISALYIGEGLSGVFPSIWALIQGSPTSSCKEYNGTVSGIRFSPTYFFFIIPLITTASLVAFTMILLLPIAKREHVKMKLPIPDNQERTQGVEEQEEGQGSDVISSQDSQPLFHKTTDDNSNGKRIRKLAEYVCIEIILCFFANSFLSSIIPYFTLPYGPSAFVWALNLMLIAIPIGSFLGGILIAKNTWSLWCMLACFLLISTWLTFLAVWRGAIPLAGSSIGRIHVVLLQALTGMLAGYIKVGVGIQAKNEGGTAFMFCIAAATQAGSLIGALTAFILVNYSKILST